ncbi:heme/hemin ABC transporter substrate-binding protein [Nesterenkonia populi]
MWRNAFVVVAAVGLLVTGCGLGDAESPLETDEQQSSAAQEQAPEESSAEEGPDWPEPADAAELTGPSSSQNIGDVDPLDGEPEPNFPVTITDDRGEEITVESAERVLALDIYGTLSDIALGLGFGDRLVGRTASDENEAMQDLPNVTEGGHVINAEAVLELEPDLLLHDTTLGPREALEQVEAAGVTVVHFTPERELDGVEDLMLGVAAALGVPGRGETLAERFGAEIAQAQEYIEHLASRTEDPPLAAVLYIRGNAGVFFIMGRDNGVDDLMGSLHLDDAASAAGISGLHPANAEALAELNPELILVMTKGLESTGGLEGLLARPGVGQTQAGHEERIIDAPDAQLLSFGPNSPAALVALAEAVYLADPEAEGIGAEALEGAWSGAESQ